MPEEVTQPEDVARQLHARLLKKLEGHCDSLRNFHMSEDPRTIDHRHEKLREIHECIAETENDIRRVKVTIKEYGQIRERLLAFDQKAR